MLEFYTREIKLILNGKSFTTGSKGNIEYNQKRRLLTKIKETLLDKTEDKGSCKLSFKYLKKEVYDYYKEYDINFLVQLISSHLKAIGNKKLDSSFLEKINTPKSTNTSINKEDHLIKYQNYKFLSSQNYKYFGSIINYDVKEDNKLIVEIIIDKQVKLIVPYTFYFINKHTYMVYLNTMNNKFESIKSNLITEGKISDKSKNINKTDKENFMQTEINNIKEEYYIINHESITESANLNGTEIYNKKNEINEFNFLENCKFKYNININYSDIEDIFVMITEIKDELNIDIMLLKNMQSPEIKTGSNIVRISIDSLFILKKNINSIFENHKRFVYLSNKNQKDITTTVILRLMIILIVLHEIGHITKKHNKKSIHNEYDADEYASKKILPYFKRYSDELFAELELEDGLTYKFNLELVYSTLLVFEFIYDNNLKNEDENKYKSYDRYVSLVQLLYFHIIQNKFEGNRIAYLTKFGILYHLVTFYLENHNFSKIILLRSVFKSLIHSVVKGYSDAK